MAENFSSIVDKLTEFIEIKAEQVRLKLISGGSGVFAFILTGLLVTILAVFFVLFLGVAFAELINYYMDSRHVGYFVIAGIFLFFTILSILLFKTNKLRSWIEHILMDQKNTDGED